MCQDDKLQKKYDERRIVNLEYFDAIKKYFELIDAGQYRLELLEYMRRQVEKSVMISPKTRSTILEWLREGVKTHWGRTKIFLSICRNEKFKSVVTEMMSARRRSGEMEHVRQKKNRQSL